VWFWFSSFNIFWYGRKPTEQFVLELFISGPYLIMFFITFFSVFIIPMWTIMWNPVRKSIWGPPIIAVSILIGTLFDRLRLFVASYSIEGIGDAAVDKLHRIPVVPPANFPDLADILIVVGAISGAIFLYLLAARIIPIFNIWEQRELKLYQVHKRFHRTEVQVLGKPD
jgi:Ni/Fe-hydrogenase subunit HybB-like protein